MVAASIILITRHTLGLAPCWTTKLRKVTGYLKKDLTQCCSLLGYYFKLCIFNFLRFFNEIYFTFYLYIVFNDNGI